ncbi:DUF3365 domain-containing protein [Aliiglaciecola sp. LCG003]|uniref:Tll0287-like domain-containing protein n=1 Tax=Aliiglaciecola sp. LCG003 TaxID=3053655 RepID=UPI0025726AC7|nr:DUF3365 domain-containing protein [Aliiglaciecola sp. LCG003]WJG10796.1 DUF3365 domain-containing protein [Aliiglaciecola sp. LCG003]
MTTFLKIGSASLLVMLSCQANAADPNPSSPDYSQLEQQAAQRITAFSDALKLQLQLAIKQGGLTNAIEVCKSVAPNISQEYSTEGWLLKRTSLRVRNPINAADTWETSVLEQFNGSHDSGKGIDTLRASLVDLQSSKPIYRYMRAIPIQPVCLSCHGENISGEVTEQLAQQYPQDRATGFKLGDIRGAFSLTKALD